MNRLNNILSLVRITCKDYYFRLSKKRLRIGVNPENAIAVINGLHLIGAIIMTVVYYRGFTYITIAQ